MLRDQHWVGLKAMNERVRQGVALIIVGELRSSGRRDLLAWSPTHRSPCSVFVAQLGPDARGTRPRWHP